MRDIDFPHRPNGYEFINWLYCPECGGKAGAYRYSPRFEFYCNDCGEEMEVILGVTPPFHKVTPRDIEDGIERHTEHGPTGTQEITPGRKLREMSDEQVARELSRAGYHDLADILEEK